VRGTVGIVRIRRVDGDDGWLCWCNRSGADKWHVSKQYLNKIFFVENSFLCEVELYILVVLAMPNYSSVHLKDLDNGVSKSMMREN
jgi:hypothetical protein